MKGPLDSGKPLLQAPEQAVLDSSKDSSPTNTMTAMIPQSHSNKAPDDNDDCKELFCCCILAILCAVVPSQIW